MRATLVEMLSDEGYFVAAAPNGKDALEVLRSSDRRFDLILLDLMMPVMNGWQFRKEQACDPQHGTIPVLVLSAGTHVQEAAASIGAVGFLRKPIKVDTLLGEVARHCKRAPGDAAGSSPR